MPEKKKQKKNGSQGLSNKIDIIYEILSAHKMDLESIELQVKELSSSIGKVKGRMGL
tara:strand:+ start:333 stop:503 length:171 start_codon:yes stop_codon:yes gene_type:complete